MTKSPPGLNYDENTSDKDDITALAMVQRWPRRTWDSLYERAAFQAERLQDLAAEDEALILVRTAEDLARAEERHTEDGRTLAAVLGAEGAHPLEGDIANLDRLYREGFRVLGLQHFFDNELGGSLHGTSGAGLTDFGRAVVEGAEEREMIIDVAHSSQAVVREVLAMTRRPVIISHTGFKGHCDSARNIPDALMIEIAEAGGLIGVGYWGGAICDVSPKGIADAILYGIDLVGIDHIALGSDFDGSVATPFDTAGLAALTHALLDGGLDDAEIAAVMGGNQIRFFRDYLPKEG